MPDLERHCERSEAIWLGIALSPRDCFVAPRLAMTTNLWRALSEALAKKDPLVLRRIVEPDKFDITEPRIELRPLEGEGIDKRRMAAELAGMPLGLGHQPVPDPLSAQLGLDPQQRHEQSAGVAIADQPGADRTLGLGAIADENAKIRVAGIPQKSGIVGAESLVDELAVGPARVVLEAEPKP